MRILAPALVIVALVGVSQVTNSGPPMREGFPVGTELKRIRCSQEPAICAAIDGAVRQVPARGALPGEARPTDNA